MTRLLRLIATTQEGTHSHALVEWFIPNKRIKELDYDIRIGITKFRQDPYFKEADFFLSYVIDRRGFFRWLFGKPYREFVWTVKVV